ncbi:MAG: response regulator [Clostridiales bacterium]|nr:response regulator [Clostridiales bacterium]
MRMICVDDEPLAVEYTLSQCTLLPEIDDVKGFTEAQSALDWLRTHPTDLALLDINMPEIDGITLAARIKEMYPKIAIVFLTAYKEYAFDAYSVHPSGYLLKPVSQEKLAEEVRLACGEKCRSFQEHIWIKTFGTFDVFVDNRPVSFKLAKSKEILAYLVDKQGSGVTRSEICAAIWEDSLYDRRMQKQLDVYIRSLRETLQEYGIPEIMEMEKGVLRTKPETFVCDAYLFYSGDSDAINAYRGEYMSSYSWASMTEAILYWKSTN